MLNKNQTKNSKEKTSNKKSLIKIRNIHVRRISLLLSFEICYGEIGGRLNTNVISPSKVSFLSQVLLVSSVGISSILASTTIFVHMGIRATMKARKTMELS